MSSRFIFGKDNKIFNEWKKEASKMIFAVEKRETEREQIQSELM